VRRFDLPATLDLRFHVKPETLATNEILKPIVDRESKPRLERSTISLHKPDRQACEDHELPRLARISGYSAAALDNKMMTELKLAKF